MRFTWQVSELFRRTHKRCFSRSRTPSGGRRWEPVRPWLQCRLWWGSSVELSCRRRKSRSWECPQCAGSIRWTCQEWRSAFVFRPYITCDKIEPPDRPIKYNIEWLGLCRVGITKKLFVIEPEFLCCDWWVTSDVRQCRTPRSQPGHGCRPILRTCRWADQTSRCTSDDLRACPVTSRLLALQKLLTSLTIFGILFVDSSETEQHAPGRLLFATMGSHFGT